MPADCSLLMLTRNETELLPYVLSWCRNAFKELIVLNTEADDATEQIVKRFAGRFLTSPVRDDFSLLRNMLQDAAGCDWVFHLNADELADWNLLGVMQNWIRPDSKDRLPNVVAFKFPRYNAGAKDFPDYQTRLLNRKYCSWQRPIHERVVLKSTGLPVDEEQGGMRFCQTLDSHPIIHLPRSLEQLKATRERWSLLEKNHDINPPSDTVEVNPEPTQHGPRGLGL